VVYNESLVLACAYVLLSDKRNDTVSESILSYSRYDQWAVHFASMPSLPSGVVVGAGLAAFAFVVETVELPPPPRC